MLLIYRCFRTRKEVMADVARAPHGSPEAFFGTPLGEDEEAARVEAGDPFAWRLSLARARDELGSAYDRLGFEELEEGGHRFVRAEPEAFGDVVIARKDTPTSYHLSSCHDDTLQGVTHIVRGEDLFASTSVHVLLQALMGWPTPIYRHHRLLTGEDGKRLSKRDKSTSLRSMRAAGIIPDEIRQRTGAPL
ncbi:MAG: glutamate--tRNA ligase family protein [Pseudomonadota bacterium]